MLHTRPTTEVVAPFNQKKKKSVGGREGSGLTRGRRPAVPTAAASVSRGVALCSIFDSMCVLGQWRHKNQRVMLGRLGSGGRVNNMIYQEQTADDWTKPLTFPSPRGVCAGEKSRHTDGAVESLSAYENCVKLFFFLLLHL